MKGSNDETTEEEPYDPLTADEPPPEEEAEEESSEGEELDIKEHVMENPAQILNIYSKISA